tara:strand:+ start:3178 stop:3795 length:618 start_codon:yes stop_codon:yes gene_type:complete
MRFVHAAVAALAAMVASAPVLSSPGECIRIENDLDRLACYDRETGRTPKQAVVRAPRGKWLVTKETSKLSDRTNVYLQLKSDEVVDCGWNSGEKIELQIRCHENTTALFFHTGCHMTSSDYNGYGDITYRLDKEKARKVSTQESTNNKSLGLWRGGQSIPVIKQMFDKKSMLVRMTPYSENPFTATFKIAGLETAIEPLRKACNW